MKTRTVRPAGFTLVELLMVILIIGMLVTLIGSAAYFAVRAAKRAAIRIEMSNLDAAMQDLSSKSLGGEYPPCMAIPVGATTDRYVILNRMLRKRFPRSTQAPITQASPTLSAWKVRHGDLQNSLYDHILDFSTMDAAEALVFWLAGPPAPGTANSSTILYGFSANATTPFAPAGSRLATLYSFDETRLTDADDDGWPEYTPPGVTAKVSVAPYVYFDAASYTYIEAAGTTYVACYPGTTFKVAPAVAQPSPSIVTEQALINNWGFVAPYSDGSSAPFWNQKKFQIISAGLDSEYGAAPGDEVGSIRSGVAVVPKSGVSAVPTLLQGDWDNQVNFVDGVLEDQTGQ